MIKIGLDMRRYDDDMTRYGKKYGKRKRTRHLHKSYFNLHSRHQICLPTDQHSLSTFWSTQCDQLPSNSPLNKLDKETNHFLHVSRYFGEQGTNLDIWNFWHTFGYFEIAFSDACIQMVSKIGTNVDIWNVWHNFGCFENAFWDACIQIVSKIGTNLDIWNVWHNFGCFQDAQTNPSMPGKTSKDCAWRIWEDDDYDDLMMIIMMMMMMLRMMTMTKTRLLGANARSEIRIPRAQAHLCWHKATYQILLIIMMMVTVTMINIHKYPTVEI